MSLKNKSFVCLFLCPFFLFSKQSSFIVEDEKGNIIDLYQNFKYFIVICYSQYNCIGCFKKLETQIKKYKKFELFFLARIPENNYVLKKKYETQIRNHFKWLKKGKFKIFFDVHAEKDPWPPYNLKDGIFGKYKISKTPAYFICTNDTIIFVPYEKIEKELYK